MSDQYPPDVVEAVARTFCAETLCGGECYVTRHGMMHGPCEARTAQGIAILRTLTALGYRRVPEGHVVVPREATEAMCHAAIERQNGPPNEVVYYAIYRAMVAAANPD